MKSSERLRELAKKTPEEILAEADEIAKIEEDLEAQEEEVRNRPLSIDAESQCFAWSIERWVTKGADMKMVVSIIAAGFAKVFVGKGYVLKIKTEKLF